MRMIDKRIEAKLAAPLIKRAPTLTLPFDDRCKSRLAATLDNGEEVALVLPPGTVLRDGDMLVADDGGLVRVIAAEQDVLVVHAHDAITLTRAAYHLGNRHTPVVEVAAGQLKLEADPGAGRHAQASGRGARGSRDGAVPAGDGRIWRRSQAWA